jgi:hypothetical protein
MAQTDDVPAVLTSVAAYGGQLSAALHLHALTCARIPRRFGDNISGIDIVVKTLKELLTLVQNHVEPGKNHFSQEGLEYTRLLAVKCGVTFAKIEVALTESYLDDNERKALKKQRKAAQAVPVVDPTKLSLGENFLKRTQKWMLAWNDDAIQSCMHRLCDLQVHLTLVFQVVSVGALSKDV